MFRKLSTFWSKKISALITYAFVRYSSIMGRSFDLVNKSQKAREKDYLAFNCRATLFSLLSDPIVFLDVGAGGASEPVTHRYSEFFSSIFVEPRTSEAVKLKNSGALVIDKCVSDKVDSRILYRTSVDELSSLLSPNSDFASYYSSGMEVVGTTQIETTTISKALAEFDVKHLDYLKVDTQGTELDVLKGLGNYRPIFVRVEIYFVPIYKECCLIWNIGEFLSNNGYVMFDLAYRSNYLRRSPRYYMEPVGRLPTGGRVWFMPNWKCEKGRELILERDLQYAKLMTMFGMKDVLEEVFSELITPNRDKILVVL